MIKVELETDSARLSRLRLEAIDKALQGINVAVSKLDHESKLMVYGTLLVRLQGRVSAKIRRKAVTAYHKGARRS